MPQRVRERERERKRFHEGKMCLLVGVDMKGGRLMNFKIGMFLIELSICEEERQKAREMEEKNQPKKKNKKKRGKILR